MTAIAVDDYIRHDATGLADLVRTGEARPSELLDAAIDRLQKVDGDLGAVVQLHADMARSALGTTARNAVFSGVPFLLKDLFTDLEGSVSENGSTFHVAGPAAHDCTVVSRYKAAGLSIFGKTHSPEFGGTSTSESRRFGMTRNPHANGLSAGGSSGGAAAAVASGVVPAAQATDAGGSIIIPASCCGLLGLKPSRGRVPLGPVRHEGAGGLATQHVITRTVRDSAAFLDVETSPDDVRDGLSRPAFERFSETIRQPLRRLRIAILHQSVEGIVPDPECLLACDDAAQLCAGLGHRTMPVVLPIDTDRYARAEQALRLASVAATVRGLEQRIGRAANESDLEPATWERYRTGLQITGSEVLEAREAMLDATRQVHAFMADFDVILSPSMATLPPPPGTIGLNRTDAGAAALNRQCTTFARVYNWTGQPAISVPLHVTAAGVPVGVLFAAAFGQEGLLLQLATELEAARPWSGLAPAYRQI
ncbi:MAG TPA: amidase [Ensifer sp.]|nr:amidase [Ensifer sp.]